MTKITPVSNCKDRKPNRKARQATKSYRRGKKYLTKDDTIIQVEYTANGKKHREDLLKKQKEMKKVSRDCLAGVKTEKDQHSLPKERNVVKMEVDGKTIDVNIINFEDGGKLNALQEYERFVMSKGCWPRKWKEGFHRNSECEALKGKFAI